MRIHAVRKYKLYEISKTNPIFSLDYIKQNLFVIFCSYKYQKLNQLAYFGHSWASEVFFLSSEYELYIDDTIWAIKALCSK